MAMNRRAFLTLAGMAGVSSTLGLSGCGDGASTSSGGTTEISYWLWQDNATDTTWQDLANEFNAAQSAVRVALQVIPLAQYQDKLLTAATSGNGPDAARCKDWWVGQFAPKKALADLTSRVDAWNGGADVVSALWDTGRIPGAKKIYMLPHQFVTLYLYYRKDFFASLGLAAPKTQQDVLTAAERLIDPNSKRYGMDVRGGAGGQDQWLAFMFAGGASVVSGSDVVLDDAVATAVNQSYIDLERRLHAAPPGSVTAAFSQVQANFAAGTTGMMIHHVGSLGALRPALGDRLGVVPMPSADPSKPATLGSMSGNVILSSSRKQDAAWKWISWLSEKPAMSKLSGSAQGQLPVLASVAKEERFASDPYFQVALAAEAYAKTWPALPGVAQIAAKEWGANMQSAFLGKTTSAEMLKALSAVLRERK
jgi:multiple sugar transport system substrate-binding protein